MQFKAHPSFRRGSFRLGQLPAADGTAAQQLIGGGEIKSGWSKTADLQQNGLLIGGQGGVQSIGGGGALRGLRLGSVPDIS